MAGPHTVRIGDGRVAVALAVGVWVATAGGWWVAEWRARERAELLMHTPAQPGMALTCAPGELPPILRATARDGYVWIDQAQTLVRESVPRNKVTVLDGAPDGREVHWNSGWPWVLAGLGWLHHLGTGCPWEAAVARAAEWANPLLYVLGGGALALLAWRRWGLRGAVAVLVAQMAAPQWQAAFPWGNPDHHGLHALAVAATVLGLAAAGWGMAGGYDARRWMMGSAVAMAAGFWFSAVVQGVVLAALVLGMTVAVGRRGMVEGDLPTWGLWRLWGWTAAGGVMFFWILESAPGFEWRRLEVVHPVHALASAGAGEWVAWLMQRASPSGRRGWAAAAGALAALGAGPLIVLVAGPSFFLPLDVFVYRIHEFIAEFRSTAWHWEFGDRWAVEGAVGLPTLALAVALARAWEGGWASLERRQFLVIATLLAVFGALAFLQFRWWMVAPAVVVGAAPMLAGWVGETTVRRAGVVTALAMVTCCGLAPILRLERARPADPGDALMVLLRDVAARVREDAGAAGRPVVLASPNASVPLAYFGRFQAVGTLYWENHEGLRTAARIYSALSDAEAWQEARSAGVDYMVFVDRGDFLLPYFRVQHAGLSDREWPGTFGHRVFLAGRVPWWLVPVEYQVAPELQWLRVRVNIYRVRTESGEMPGLAE